jgi:hypothetical protein
MTTTLVYLVFYPLMQMLWRAAWSREWPLFTRNGFEFAYVSFTLPGLVVAATDIFSGSWWWVGVTGSAVTVLPSMFLFGEYFEAKFIPGLAITGAGAALCCAALVRIL